MFDFDDAFKESKEWENCINKSAKRAMKFHTFRFSFQGEDELDKQILEDLEEICDLTGIINSGVLSTTDKDGKTFYCIQFKQSDPETIKLVQTLHSKIVSKRTK